MDTTAGVVRVNRKPVSLSPKEYQLLAYLHERRGQVCSKDEIGHAVWPEYEAGGIFDYQIENLVRRLRTRIETDPANPQLLFTVRGLGYKVMAAWNVSSGVAAKSTLALELLRENYCPTCSFLTLFIE